MVSTTIFRVSCLVYNISTCPFTTGHYDDAVSSIAHHQKKQHNKTHPEYGYAFFKAKQIPLY
jgi:hypothetical protein